MKFTKRTRVFAASAHPDCGYYTFYLGQPEFTEFLQEYTGSNYVKQMYFGRRVWCNSSGELQELSVIGLLQIQGMLKNGLKTALWAKVP